MEIPANNLIEHIGCWLVIIAVSVIVIYILKLTIALVKHCDNRRNEEHEKQMQEARIGKIAGACAFTPNVALCDPWCQDLG